MAIQINIGTAGPIPTPPAQLRAQLVARVAQLVPGYTFELPASLIDDISGTDVGAIAIIEQLGIDLVNSISARTANPFILNALGQMYGVAPGQATNTSVFLVFTGTPGFVISRGFVVSDGTYQYVLVDGGIVATGGQSAPLFATATIAGSWAVPAGTVTQILTSVPSGFPLTVVNPQPGIPGTDTQTEASYRTDVLTAGLVAAQGYFSMLLTRLKRVSGVQRRLINAIPQSGGGWEILCGGGDPYEVAYGIYQSTQDISTLRGSTLNISNITNANPGEVSTDLTHGLSAGQPFQIAGANPSLYNGSYSVVSVLDSHTVGMGKPYPNIAIASVAWSGGLVVLDTVVNPHNITVGSTIIILGVPVAGYNGTFVVTSVPNPDQLIYALAVNPGGPSSGGIIQAGIALFNTTLLSPWVSGGVITPNPRSISATIVDYPNSYIIPFAIPLQQTVTMTITWNTISTNIVSSAAVEQASAPAIVAYINSIPTGKPINEMQLDDAFQAAVEDIVPRDLLSRLVYAISIDGVGTAPDVGTREVYGDPQSFFFAVVTGINVVQG